MIKIERERNPKEKKELFKEMVYVKTDRKNVKQICAWPSVFL